MAQGLNLILPLKIPWHVHIVSRRCFETFRGKRSYADSAAIWQTDCVPEYLRIIRS